MEKSLSARFLKRNERLLQLAFSWGFYIIRPSALAADDGQWSAALSRVRECILAPFYESDEDILRTTGVAPEPSLTRQVADALMLPVLDLDLPPDPAETTHHGPRPTSTAPQVNPVWPSARFTPPPSPLLLQSARSMFSDYIARYCQEMEERHFVTELDHICRTGCILIDDITLKELTANMDEDDLRVIILDPDNDELSRHFSGWMYAQITALEILFQDLTGDSVASWRPKPRFQGQLPLYNGVPSGALIDPPEGVGPVLGGTTRGQG